MPFIALCQGSALERGLAAGDLAKAVAGILGGGGGGKPDMAQGQGLEAGRVEDATREVWERVEATLAG